MRDVGRLGRFWPAGDNPGTLHNRRTRHLSCGCCTGVYLSSENDAEQFCDQLFQRHHGKGKGKDRQQDDDDELDHRFFAERDRPDAPDYLETVSQVGERLYIATPDELLIRRCAAANPFLIEVFDISARQLPVLAQAGPLGTQQVRAKGKERSQHHHHDYGDKGNRLEFEIHQLRSCIEDPVGYQSRKQHPMCQNEQRHRKDAYREETETRRTVGVGGYEAQRVMPDDARRSVFRAEIRAFAEMSPRRISRCSPPPLPGSSKRLVDFIEIVPYIVIHREPRVTAVESHPRAPI